MLINEFIYRVGCKRRNPTLMKQYASLKQTEKKSREELEQIQMEKLRNLLEIAYNNTGYYRRIFDDLGLRPKDIVTKEDLKKLPLLEKSDILKYGEQIRNYTCQKVVKSETSGSTGEPLVFYRNEEWESAARAAQMRGYSWYGVKPWERNGYLWGHLYGSKFELRVRILDFLVNRFRMFSYKKDDVLNFAKKLRKASYLEGYSSMIYEVAKEVNRQGIGPYALKMVKGTSEKIYDSYQSEVKRAFGQKMISEYGAAETTMIAFECPHGNMHVVMENVIVEVENGDIVVTNLNSFSMPIIRYRLGDSIVLNSEKQCPCGMQHEIIEDVLGRTGKNIYGFENKYPSLTLYYIFKSVALKTGNTVNYQGVQTKKGYLDILLDREMTATETLVIKEECINYFGKDISVRLKPNALERDHTKKFKDFISQVE